MELQIALDDITLKDSLALIKKIYPCVDIIEIGTPMVMEYGMAAVREMKKQFPDKKVLADLKIMDAGYYEAEIALRAGADYITVLGLTDNKTIRGCVDAAKAYGKSVAADMICVGDIERRVRKLEELGVDFVSVHTGVDQQAAGRTPLDDLKVMKDAVKTAKISVAGGITTDTLSAYQTYQPEVIIVGSGITHAKEPEKEAEKIYGMIKKPLADLSLSVIL